MPGLLEMVLPREACVFQNPATVRIHREAAAQRAGQVFQKHLYARRILMITSEAAPLRKRAGWLMF